MFVQYHSMLLLYTNKGLGGWALLSSFAKQQQKCAYSNLQDLPAPLFYRSPAVCEKTFFASFVPQPAENTTRIVRLLRYAKVRSYHYLKQ